MSIVVPVIGCFQPAPQLRDHAAWLAAKEGLDVSVHVGGTGGGGQQGVLALGAFVREVFWQRVFQRQGRFVVQDVPKMLAGVDPAQHRDEQCVL